MDAQVLEVEKRTPNKKGACRKLHITQFVVAVPGILIGAATLVWLIGQR